MANPNSPAATTGGQNGAAPSAESKLLEMLTRQDGNPTDKTSPAPADAPDTAPEATTETPPPEGADGQNDLPAEETSEQTDLSQTQAALPPELAALPDDVRAELLAMAKDVADGKTSFGELKRGHKLTEKFAAQLAELKAKLETREPATAEPPASSLPQEVKAQRTLAELKRYEDSVQEAFDFCVDNPEGGTFRGREYSPEEVKQAKTALRSQLRAIPQRAQQIQQAEQVRQQRAQASSAFAKDFPAWNDPENADARLARQLLQDPRFESDVNADYIAFAIARGHRELQAELAARKNGKPATKPAATNGVPRGKPAVAPAAAAPRPGTVNVKQVLAKARSERSSDALAELIGAAGL